MSNDTSQLWWKNGVFYQIYPRSFMDNNGDGIGDLKGIIDRLDYLVDLGVDAIWISPIYPSPMKDFGYDPSDHTDINPMFGDLQVFDELVSKAHENGMRVVLDYIPNHTSDQHPWFVESKSSKDNPKRDWYIWRDPKEDGSPPNNWESWFGGSAWQLDETTGQYYLHMFLKEQPDVNWDHPPLKEGMLNILKFWLDRGVDGFRVDAINVVGKDTEFPDNPPLVEDSRFAAFDFQFEPLHNYFMPSIFDRIREFRHIADKYEGRILIGETTNDDPRELATFYGSNLDLFHIPHHMGLMYGPWDPKLIREKLTAYYSSLPTGAEPNFVLGNHDTSRLATRIGYYNHRTAAMLLLTLWGIPTIYYGEELGMEDVDVPLTKEQDPLAFQKPGLGRDPERTPMQWDASPNAGFTPDYVEPWLPLSDNYQFRNVEVQQQDPRSTLNLYKKLLHYRRKYVALHQGTLEFMDEVPEGMLGYVRTEGDQTIMIILNFTGEQFEADFRYNVQRVKPMLSTTMRDIEITNGVLKIKAYESVMIEII